MLIKGQTNKPTEWKRELGNRSIAIGLTQEAKATQGRKDLFDKWFVARYSQRREWSWVPFLIL